MPGIPAAAQTFNFQKVYLHRRNGPNNWSVAETLYDNGTGAQTFSADILTTDRTSRRGIICKDISAFGGGVEAIYLGNGLPDTIKPFPAGYEVWDFWDMSHGWWVGDAFYALMYKTSTSGVSILRTEDDGDSWTHLDEANEPLILNDALVRYDPDTKTVFVLADNNGPGAYPYSLFTFDISGGVGTEAWSAPFGGFDATRQLALRPGNGIVPYPNGDIGVFFSDANIQEFPLDFTPYSKTYYKLYAAAAWGSEITVANPGAPTSAAYPFTLSANLIIAPSKELIHFFYYAYDDSTPGTNFHPVYETVEHDGTLVPDIFTFPEYPDPDGTDGVGASIIYNGEMLVPYDRKSALKNSVWVAPVATGAFTEEFLPVPTGEEGRTPSCAYMIFAQPVFSRIPPEYVGRRHASDADEPPLAARGKLTLAKINRHLVPGL